jgi:hypothetical protein
VPEALAGIRGFDGLVALATAAIQDEGGVADAFTADVTNGRQVADLVAAAAGSLGPVDAPVLGFDGSRGLGG